MLHYHLLVELKGKVADGTTLKDERQFWKSLTTRYHLGPVLKLNPVRDPLAIGVYLAKSLRREWVSAKRLRRIAYSGSARANRRYTGVFQTVSGESKAYRDRAKRFVHHQYDAGNIPEPTAEAMAAKYGARWQFTLSYHIDQTPTDGCKPQLPLTAEEYSAIRAALAAARRTYCLPLTRVHSDQ